MLILASASPRRREILRRAEIAFETRPVDVDESPRPAEAARDYVLRLAEAKARAAARPGETVLGADTVVVIDGKILGKPSDPEEAKAMLRLLSGRTHDVLTGVCLLEASECLTFVERTLVRFKKLGDQGSASLRRQRRAAGQSRWLRHPRLGVEIHRTHRRLLFSTS